MWKWGFQCGTQTEILCWHIKHVNVYTVQIPASVRSMAGTSVIWGMGAASARACLCECVGCADLSELYTIWSMLFMANFLKRISLCVWCTIEQIRIHWTNIDQTKVYSFHFKVKGSLVFGFFHSCIHSLHGTFRAFYSLYLCSLLLLLACFNYWTVGSGSSSGVPVHYSISGKKKINKQKPKVYQQKSNKHFQCKTNPPALKIQTHNVWTMEMLKTTVEILHTIYWLIHAFSQLHTDTEKWIICGKGSSSNEIFYTFLCMEWRRWGMCGMWIKREYEEVSLALFISTTV